MTLDQVEKLRGRRRHESSFMSFRNFITKMEMGEVKFREDTFTWGNSRENEGFIQERLDRFFRSVDWIVHCTTVK